MRRGLLAVLLCTAFLAVPPAGVAAARQPVAPTSRAKTSALVVFLGPGQPLAGRSEADALERELASIPTLSIGILSATQGAYSAAQMVLDITQGARVSSSAYKPANPSFLQMELFGTQAGTQADRQTETQADAQAETPGTQANRQTDTQTDGQANTRTGTQTNTRADKQATSGGANVPVGSPARSLGINVVSSTQVEAWPAVLARAHSAPQLLDPGLLAAQIPGEAAYVHADGVESVDGVLAANRSGHITAVLGSSSTMLSSIDELQARHRLVVADLPRGPQGYADLRALAASRPTGELLVVIQRPPDEPNNTTAGQAGRELLWVGLAGVGDGGQALTSQTTDQRGLVAAIDIGPTILDHLGLRIPPDMRGRTIRTDGALDGASLRALRSRLEVIDSRRLPAAAWLIAFWALLLAAARLLDDRRFRRSPIDAQRAHRPRAAWAMRVGALAMLWTPVAVLIPAALEPSRTTELTMLVTVCFALGALTDRLVPWPRAPLAPAIAAVLAISFDALAGTQLLMRSLLGPNPAFGARFYGIGNELKSGLAVLVFAAVAAALYPAVRSRRAAATMAGAGILLAIVEGSARIGAGVGGVILVSAGTAVATVMLLPGTLNRRRVLLVMAAPIIGLVLLAAIDLTTAHGSGHFTGSVLDARSAGDIRDIIVRRYGAAYDELKNHLMPFATALALLASVVAVHRRERVCAPVNSDPAWLAALAGGLTAGVIGALSEDSGPVLLVVAVFALGSVLSYLWGQPASVKQPTTSNRDTHPATRSRALRRSAAPSG